MHTAAQSYARGTLLSRDRGSASRGWLQFEQHGLLPLRQASSVERGYAYPDLAWAACAEALIAEDVAMMLPINWVEGERVEVQLHGDEAWYTGIVMDRPRKRWVQLENYGRPMIADENSINDWRAPVTIRTGR